MALIVCTECGRAVSTKATACVGCGAPIEPASQIDWVPRHSSAAPPTLKQLRRHLLAGSLTLGLGLCTALAADRSPAGGVGKLAAALLLIAGIAWTLVTLVRLWAFERP